MSGDAWSAPARPALPDRVGKGLRAVARESEWILLLFLAWLGMT